MADITNQTQLVYTNGDCQRTCLYSVKNTDASDTVDLAGQFRVIKRAGIVSDTGTTIAAIVTIAGTTVTIPTGPTDDGVWLIVVGVSQ
jgi:hypothetical protein